MKTHIDFKNEPQIRMEITSYCTKKAEFQYIRNLTSVLYKPLIKENPEKFEKKFYEMCDYTLDKYNAYKSLYLNTLQNKINSLFSLNIHYCYTKSKEWSETK